MEKNNVALQLSVLILVFSASFSIAEDISVQVGITSNEPTITNVLLRDADDTQYETQLDPEVEYLIKFTVDDENTLDDIDSIYVNVYESTQDMSNTSTRTSYLFIYDGMVNLWGCIPAGYINPSHSSTVPGNKSETQFEFSLYFMLDGIAAPTGENQTWIVNVTVYDLSNSSDYDTNVTFDVNEYRSIDSYNNSIQWTGMSPGDTLDNLSVNPIITTNVQVNMTTTGANLTSGSDNIPVSQFRVWNTDSGFTLSTSPISLYDEFVDVFDSVNEKIEGYTDGQALPVKYDGTIPNPQAAGTYSGTWTIVLEDISNPN